MSQPKPEKIRANPSRRPITQIEDDHEAAAAGATDYTVVSEFTPLDCVINFFTSFVTVYRKTITIEK